MTPTATTPAGRTGQGTGGSHRTPQGHRKTIHRQAVPRVQRRVSGPFGRRVAGVGQPASKRRAPVRPTGASSPFPSRARAFLRSLPDRAVIDRLVRGRAWILALGIMLTGIVAMQVELLKLGADIGRSVQRSSALQIRNEQLQSSVASLADDQRIEKLAAGMGMVMAPPGSVGFVSGATAGNRSSALANLRSPSATTFLNPSSTNGSLVTATTIAAANAPVASPATGSQTTSTTGGTAAAAYLPSTAASAVAPATQSPSTTSPSATSAGG